MRPVEALDLDTPLEADPQTAIEFKTFCLVGDLEELQAATRNPALKRHVQDQREMLKSALETLSQIDAELEKKDG